MNKMIDWKTMPKGKEKYHAYLASREWALKKEAIKVRSGGICERCKRARGTQTHHQTYDNLYKESLHDLLHVCAECHLFLSGKSNIDPAVKPFKFNFMGKQIKTVYLAGKITPKEHPNEVLGAHDHEEMVIANRINHDWRTSIFPDWEDDDNHYYSDWKISEKSISFDVVPQHGNTCKIWLDYSGPYFAGEQHCGYGYAQTNEHSRGEFSKEHVFQQIEKAIDACDLMFVWVDSLDCYGTLVEIGMAKAKGKKIVFAYDEKLNIDELWIAELCGVSIPAATAKAAFHKLIMMMKIGPEKK